MIFKCDQTDQWNPKLCNFIALVKPILLQERGTSFGLKKSSFSMISNKRQFVKVSIEIPWAECSEKNYCSKV